MIVNLAHVLVPARRQGYTIGAFNIYNLETISAGVLGRPTIWAVP